jgi:dihydroorotase
MKITIKNARLIDPRHSIDTVASLHIADGRVVGVDSPPANFNAEQVINAEGLIACPGFIDLSARLPKLKDELLAAVAGGVTTVVCPPDSKPTLDDPENVERLVRNAQELGLARVLPLGALTLDLQGERLSELITLKKAGCVAFSQGNKPILDTEALLRAFEYAATFDLPIWLQPRDYHLGRNGVAHDGEIAARLGLAGIPAAAEAVAISTALTLADLTGVRLHLQRISSATGMALIEAAQANGQKVTCDVGIHHLHLSEHDIGFFDSRARFDPPLRALQDRNVLRTAIKYGKAAICSDHTPVGNDDKLLPFPEAVAGATGLELLLPLTLKWAQATKTPLEMALATLTSFPAEILGKDFTDIGHLGVGAKANICLFSPTEFWVPSAENIRSAGKHSPLMGYEVSGKVRHTFVEGRQVY